MTIRHSGLGILVLLTLFIISSAQAGPLHDAVKKGDLAQVRRLIDKGADVNAKDNKGWTPLVAASLEGHGEIVKALLAKGADVNAKNKQIGLTSLVAASVNGHDEVVKALLAKGADVYAKSRKGWTALSIAKKERQKKIVKLLKKTADEKTAKGEDYVLPSVIEGDECSSNTWKVVIPKGKCITLKESGSAITQFQSCWEEPGEYTISGTKYMINNTIFTENKNHAVAYAAQGAIVSCAR